MVGRRHLHQRGANRAGATLYEADLDGGGEGRGAVLAGDVRYERNLARRVTGGGKYVTGGGKYRILGLDASRPPGPMD